MKHNSNNKASYQLLLEACYPSFQQLIDNPGIYMVTSHYHNTSQKQSLWSILFNAGNSILSYGLMLKMCLYLLDMV